MVPIAIGVHIGNIRKPPGFCFHEIYNNPHSSLKAFAKMKYIVYIVYIVYSLYSTYSSHHNGVEVAPEPEMERNGIVRMEILFCVFWKNQSFESANNTRAAI